MSFTQSITRSFRAGTFNVVVDGQWGSCGKGLINTALADRYRPDIISSTNMANAGHTCIVNGEKFVAKILPTSALLRRHRSYDPLVVVGPSAGFTVEQLMREMEFTGCNEKLLIHPRAGIIMDRHKEQEQSDLDRASTKHIASTMQGCGAMMSEKILRRRDVLLAKDIMALEHFTNPHKHPALSSANEPSLTMCLNMLLNGGSTILHEGSQGFSLGIHHGSHYPHCTSRECTATQMMADMGISPHFLGQVVMVIRPYPIRVGNVVENGEMKGYSGDGYPGQKELTWQEVAARCGAPAHVMDGELTTVTKRLRRVFEFSFEQLRQAAIINGATHIALNFANYIDWSVYGCNEWRKLTPPVIDFIHRVEDMCDAPVTIVGTGPDNDHVCFRGDSWQI